MDRHHGNDTATTPTLDELFEDGRAIDEALRGSRAAG
jgi:hypothetical protein